MAKRSDPQLELRVLASILSGEDYIRRRLLADVEDTHFGYKYTAEIYKRIQSILGMGKDLPSMNIMASDPALSDEARALIEEAEVSAVETIVDAESILEGLDKYHKIRCLLRSAKTTAEILKGEVVNDELLTKAVTAMEESITEINAGQASQRIIHVGQGSNSDDFVRGLIHSSKPDLIETGFKYFDSRAGGFSRGSLVIIASSRGGGKSTVALQTAITSYRQHNRSVCTLLYELSEEEYIARLLSNISGVPYSLVSLRKWSISQKQKVFHAWEEFNQHGQINNCRFTVLCPRNGSVTEGIRIVRPFKYDLVIWDMITLMEGPNAGAPGWEALGDIARILKIEANAQKNVQLALAQLNPDMQVKYSRAIEEHANNVWGWRYGDEEKEMHKISVKQLKSRGSEPFDFFLHEDFAHMRITDHIPGVDDDYTPPDNAGSGGLGMGL